MRYYFRVFLPSSVIAIPPWWEKQSRRFLKEEIATPFVFIQGSQ